MTLPGTPITPLFPLLERKEPFSKSLNPLSTKKSQVLPPIGLVLSFTLSNTQRLKDYHCYRIPMEKGGLFFMVWGCNERWSTMQSNLYVHTVKWPFGPRLSSFPFCKSTWTICYQSEWSAEFELCGTLIDLSVKASCLVFYFTRLNSHEWEDFSSSIRSVLSSLSMNKKMH